MKRKINNSWSKLSFLLILLLSERALAQTYVDNSVRLKDNLTSYECPKPYELMNIALALTDSSIVTNGYKLYFEIVDTSTNYYKEVIKHFAPFRNHPFIQSLNKKLRKRASYYNANLKLAYNASMIDAKTRKQKLMPWARRVAYGIGSVKFKLLEEFANASRFENFYQLHLAYYQQVLEQTKEYADVNSQQVWLEQQFSSRYQQYNIVVSPLMNSTNFTQRFNFKGGRKCIMWVSMFSEDNKLSKKLNTGLYTGVVMTEVDHNYVNPASAEFKRELNKLMGGQNRARWANDQYAARSYKNGFKVFNEYMTHAVYLLYTLQKYPANEQQQLEAFKIKSMEFRRGFIQFSKFYQKLKEVYLAKESTDSIEKLYPTILSWCASN
jgi:hypothetical protein